MRSLPGHGLTCLCPKSSSFEFERAHNPQYLPCGVHTGVLCPLKLVKRALYILCHGLHCPQGVDLSAKIAIRAAASAMCLPQLSKSAQPAVESVQHVSGQTQVKLAGKGLEFIIRSKGVSGRDFMQDLSVGATEAGWWRRTSHTPWYIVLLLSHVNSS